VWGGSGRGATERKHYKHYLLGSRPKAQKRSRFVANEEMWTITKTKEKYGGENQRIFKHVESGAGSQRICEVGGRSGDWGGERTEKGNTP